MNNQPVASIYNYDSEISELKLTAHKIKALSDAFCRTFVERSDEMNLLSVKSDPEHYQYLYRSLEDVIYDLVNQADKLENKLYIESEVS